MVVATGEGFSVVDSVRVVVSGTPGSLAPTVVVSVDCAGTPNVTVRVVTRTVEVDSPWIEYIVPVKVKVVGPVGMELG